MKRKSVITQTHMSVKIDNELMPFIVNQPNKNRVINVAIKEYMEREEVKNEKERL